MVFITAFTSSILILLLNTPGIIIVFFLAIIMEIVNLWLMSVNIKQVEKKLEEKHTSVVNQYIHREELYEKREEASKQREEIFKDEVREKNDLIAKLEEAMEQLRSGQENYLSNIKKLQEKIDIQEQQINNLKIG